MAAVLQFVDQIGASPGVRLNLNDGTTWGGPLEDSTFKPPGLKYAEADTILTDGAYISASSYENRVLHLVLDIVTNGEDAKATALRALNTELNRANNILKYQPGTTPLFFRTFRTSGYELTESPQGNYTRVTVDIEAEPFAYGLRIDQAGVSVKANPALTNGCYLDVNGVTGDVETPAYIVLSADTVASGSRSASYLSVRRRGTPSSLPVAYQAESLAQSTDTAVGGSNDATASGAGNNFSTTTFATNAALAQRLALTLTEGVESHGTFRVLARVKKSAGGDTISVAAGGTSVFPSVATALPAGWSGWAWVDCGLVAFPQFTEDVAAGYSGVYPPLPTTTPLLSLYASRTSGAGTLTWDAVFLLPADEDLTVFTVPSVMAWTGTDTLVLDGPNDAVYRLVGGTAITGYAAPARGGSLPRLRPGNNRIYLIENSTTAVIGDSSTVTVSFWPRWLVV